MNTTTATTATTELATLRAELAALVADASFSSKAGTWTVRRDALAEVLERSEARTTPTEPDSGRILSMVLSLGVTEDEARRMWAERQ